MVTCILPLILVLLAGCALVPPAAPIPAPVTVKVPVYETVYCRPPKLQRPRLPIAELVADSSPADTVRAYAATVVLLKGAVKERDEVIAGCEKPASTRAAPPPERTAPSP